MSSCPDSWAAGDLGECVHAWWDFRHPDNPRVGELIKVRRVDVIGFGATFLAIEGKDAEYAWQARCFRKITIVHEPADAEFAASLRPRVNRPAGATPTGQPNSDAPAADTAGVSIDRPVGPLCSGHSKPLEPGA